MSENRQTESDRDDTTEGETRTGASRTDAPGDDSPGALSIALSVIAAAFGVQSEKNRERDFEHGNPIVYIAAGIIFTVLFVLTIMGVVALVLPD